MNLQDRTERRRAAGTVLARRAVRVTEPRDLDPQGEPYARVVTGRHIGGPGPQSGQAPGARCGERRCAGDEFGRGRAWHSVHHRVEERPQQRLGLGQHHRAVRHVERHGMGLGRHGSRQHPDPVEIVRGQRSGPPGVVVRGAQPGQQQPARDELEREHPGSAPEGRGGGGVGVRPRPCQDRQRVPYGHHQRRYHVGADVAPDDRQLLRTPLIGGRGATVRIPERDQAGTGRIRGEEDCGAAGQFRDLVECCRREPVHSDVRFLKFD